jgi:hypothetical protein
VVNAEEIVIRVETPDGVVSMQESGLSAANLAKLGGVQVGAAAAHASPWAQRVPCAAVDLSAELSIKELLDDVAELVDQLKVFLDPVPTATGAGAGAGGDAASVGGKST